MSAPLSRQRDRPAERPRGGGHGEHSSSAFSKIADWLPPASAQEPGSRRRTFLFLIAADETLMCLCLPGTWQQQTPQIQATAMHCGQPPACQTWAGPRSGRRRKRTRSRFNMTITCGFESLSSDKPNVNEVLCSSFPAIRARVVGVGEVDAGNDIYGNPIKRIKYDIKQIKVNPMKLLEFSFPNRVTKALFEQEFDCLRVFFSIRIVRCSEVLTKISTPSTLRPPLQCVE